MTKFKTKAVFFFLSLLVLFSSFSPFLLTAKAQVTPPSQSTWYYQDFDDWYNKVYGQQSQPTEIFGERYTAAQVEWVIYGVWAFLLNHFIQAQMMACLLSGASNIPTCYPPLLLDALNGIIDWLTADSNSGPYFANTPEVGQPSLIQLVFSDRAFSGIGYIKEKLNIVPVAHAQEGFGFGALSSVRSFWAASRNLSYTLLIFVIIIMAFMIMFRVRLSPQTVITVQSSIPKIVIATILITFSYPIAGFMVDLVYVVIGLFSIILVQAGVSANTAQGYIFMTDGMPIIGGGALNLMIFYIPFFFWAFLLALFANSGIFSIIPGFAAMNIFIALIITLLVLIMLIVVAIKILWTLVKALVSIYLLVIAGPLYILFGTVIPGFSFGSWLKDLAANLAVFPVAGMMFALAYAFLFTAATSVFTFLGTGITDRINDITTGLGFGITMTGGGWTPPLLVFPGGGPAGTSTGILFCFVSLSILMLIPKLSDIIKSLIQGRPFAYGTAIGEGFGPLGTAGMGGLGYGSSLEAAAYAKALKLQERGGPSVGTWRQRIHSASEFVRGASGGRVK